MVTKIDKSKSTNVKVKQKQNVNVKVHIDQRDTKKKPKKKRSNLPSAKREGVSSFSSGFTPVYIQSGNPYPISPIPSVPDATPIKTTIQQRDVPSFTNPPVTSTTNLIQQVQSRSISPLSFEENSNSNFSEMYPNVSRRNRKPKITTNSSDTDTSSLSLGSIYSLNDSAFVKTPMENKIEGVLSYEKGLMYPNMYDDASEIFSRDVKPIKIRNPRRTKKEMENARGMGENDERAIQKEREKLDRKNKKNN